MLKVTKVWVHKYASGKLLGFADVQFSLDGSDASHMTWKGFKLFQGNDGGVQIGLPQRKDEKGEKDEKGRIKYHPVIFVAREEEGGPGNDFLELLRSEIEKAYLNADDNGNGNGQKKTGNAGDVSDGQKKTGNAGDVGDGLPF